MDILIHLHYSSEYIQISAMEVTVEKSILLHIKLLSKLWRTLFPFYFYSLSKNTLGRSIFLESALHLIVKLELGDNVKTAEFPIKKK